MPRRHAVAGSVSCGEGCAHSQGVLDRLHGSYVWRSVTAAGVGGIFVVYALYYWLHQLNLFWL
jgi:hypothetical protein